MKKIPVQIKEIFVCYVGSHIANVIASQFASVVRQIVISMNGTEYSENRVHTVELEPDLLFTLVEQLGEKPEKFCGGLHMDMKQNLIASITATATAEMQKPDEAKDLQLLASIQYFNEKMQAREQEIDNWRTAKITEGRNFFLA
jgi:hypothetical protein